MSSPTRVASVDLLRGVCLLGILIMNIQSFAMPHAAYLNPTLFGSLDGADGLAWALGRLGFDCKFLNLFSMLFGASLILAGDHTRPVRRLLWLVVLGLAHAYLVWYGDVLFTYGVVGLAVFGARRWGAARLVGVGLALLLASPIAAGLLGLLSDPLPAWLAQAIGEHLDARSVAPELAAYQGGWLAQTPIRAALSFEAQTTGLLLETGWRAAGCMLLGMAAVKRRVFEGTIPAWPWVPAALASGLVLTAAGMGITVGGGFDLRPWLIGQALHELGAIPMSIGIGLGVITLARRFPGSTLLAGVGSLGRVAFTAYLMHSLLGTLVFGGHGLGLFGTWSRTALLIAPFLVWGAQILMAVWWTRRFRVGPLEALWRGLARGDFSLGSPRPTRT